MNSDGPIDGVRSNDFAILEIEGDEGRPLRRTADGQLVIAIRKADHLQLEVIFGPTRTRARPQEDLACL